MVSPLHLYFIFIFCEYLLQDRGEGGKVNTHDFGVEDGSGQVPKIQLLYRPGLYQFMPINDQILRLLLVFQVITISFIQKNEILFLFSINFNHFYYNIYN